MLETLLKSKSSKILPIWKPIWKLGPFYQSLIKADDQQRATRNHLVMIMFITIPGSLEYQGVLVNHIIWYVLIEHCSRHRLSWPTSIGNGHNWPLMINIFWQIYQRLESSPVVVQLSQAPRAVFDVATHPETELIIYVLIIFANYQHTSYVRIKECMV